MLLDGRIWIIRGDRPLQLAPELIHRIELRPLLREPEALKVELRSARLALGGALAWRFIQQPRNRAARIGLAYQMEARLDMRLLQGGATPEEPMPRAEVDGPKQDPLRVTPGNGDMRRCALERPRTTQDRKEAQDRLVRAA